MSPFPSMAAGCRAGEILSPFPCRPRFIGGAAGGVVLSLRQGCPKPYKHRTTRRYKGPLEPVHRAALALGTANQLTNILRDVGEDAKTR